MTTASTDASPGNGRAPADTSADTSKVWLLTGASRGFGRVWAEAALARGDRVAATARTLAGVADLAEAHGDRVLPLALEVTDRAEVFTVVGQVADHFGRIDVVVANAGHGLFGAIEETTEDDARRQLEVNVLGVAWLLQAVTPVLRGQQGGRVLLTSSFGGLVSFATAGLYAASKYAVEGLGESYALETRDLGITVTLVEPAAYATDFMGASEQTTTMPQYDAARQRTATFFDRLPPGDPANTAAAILDVVDMAEPPLRLLLGAHVLPVVLETYEERVRTWRSQEGRTTQAQ